MTFRKTMNNINVFNILTSLNFGGVESRASIINANNTSIAQHSFIAISTGGKAADTIRSNNGNVTLLMEKSSIPSLKAIISLYKNFRTNNPDVVHTRGAEANFHGLIAAWLARVPVRIGEEIGIPNHSLKAKLTFKFSYLFANKVIGISDAVTNWLIESGEVPAHKAVKIYNPVIIPKSRNQHDIQSDIFRIGFVGRLEPVKNPLALLEAVALIIDRGYDVELSVVGDGSQKQILIDRASELKISNRVIIHGFQHEPDRYVRQCHVYVQPSLSEGFGLALVEAMGCAVPVIATAVGGAPEIIQDNLTGWLIHKTNAKTIANKLIEVLEMPEDKLINIGLAGRKSVETRFEPAAYMKELEALYIHQLNKVKR
tara:strand:+ start:24988 stop:26100 length:1113 start_codon:yes stop_codon:yes gene_type:complete